MSAASLLVIEGSGGDGVSLPHGYNTGRNRLIEISPNMPVTEPHSQVRTLNGVDGAPEKIVFGDPDLTTRYWGRRAGRPRGSWSSR